MYAELTCNESVKVPDWVKTKEDLEKFADKYISDNLDIGYELIDEQMELDDFIEEIESSYQDAKDKNFDSIVIVIDTDLGNSYYINNTDEGFQCDEGKIDFDLLKENREFSLIIVYVGSAKTLRVGQDRVYGRHTGVYWATSQTEL